MTTNLNIEQTAARTEALRRMHTEGPMLVLPNAWDAASAKAVEAAGFSAIATTSSGVAVSMGYLDGERAPLEEMLGAARRIVAAVNVPVSVDFEAGYGLSPQEVAERLVSIGASGMNLEDTNHRGDTPLVPAEANAERLAAIKQAAKALGVNLVLNARVDTFVRKVGSEDEQLEEGLRRARLYLQAGADCIYPIMLTDTTAIRTLVDAVEVININTRREGGLALADLAALGVRRVSYAGGVFRETMTAHEGVVTAILEETKILAAPQIEIP